MVAGYRLERAPIVQYVMGDDGPHNDATKPNKLIRIACPLIFSNYQHVPVVKMLNELV